MLKTIITFLEVTNDSINGPTSQWKTFLKLLTKLKAEYGGNPLIEVL